MSGVTGCGVAEPQAQRRRVKLQFLLSQDLCRSFLFRVLSAPGICSGYGVVLISDSFDYQSSCEPGTVFGMASVRARISITACYVSDVIVRKIIKRAASGFQEATVKSSEYRFSAVLINGSFVGNVKLLDENKRANENDLDFAAHRVAP